VVLVIVLLALLGGGGYFGYTKWAAARAAAEQAAAGRAAQSAGAQSAAAQTAQPTAPEPVKPSEPEPVTPTGSASKKQPNVGTSPSAPAKTVPVPLSPPSVAPPQPSTPVEKVPEPPRGPVAVANPKVLHKVTPVYPPIARQTRVTGMVKLQVIIATDGSVREVTVLSGNAVLTAAAVSAMKQWRYEPVLLSGQPAEASTVVQFDFKMD
jgi:TonB family protein